MRVAARSLLLSSLLAAAACSPPDEGAELRAACEGACDALARPGCAEPAKDECDGQCAALVEELDGFCVEEHVTLYECLSGVEYTCAGGSAEPAEGPIPCYPQTLTTYGCVLGLACKKYCRAAEEAGCGSAGCLDRCEAGRPAKPACGTELEALRACEIEGMACSGGEPSPAGCDAERSALDACEAT